MRPVVLTVTGNGATTLNSAPVVCDWRADPTSISLFFKTSGSTTGFTVQYTGDDPRSFTSATTYNANATWFNHAFMAALTATLSGNIAYPVRAIRLQANTSGTDIGTLTIIQGAPLG
jgi:hypothetical protein